MKPDHDQMLTIKQAAELLGLSTTSIHDLRSLGKLAAYHVGPKGKAVRFRRGDLLAYVEGTKSVPQAQVQESPAIRFDGDYEMYLKYIVNRRRRAPSAKSRGGASGAGRGGSSAC
jgi:excisionase family DNA binding protein